MSEIRCAWAPLLSIYPEKTLLQKNTCTPMFIAALLSNVTNYIVAKTWKQHKCPSADEWIRKLWYIYTMGYYSAIKKNAFESVPMRWMKLEPIIHRKAMTNLDSIRDTDV